jgi:2-C-methyl-D-erythritol 2,4-cyclodiphosphate synthase
MGDEARVGIGYDIHRLVPDLPLVLGTVPIPFSMGLYGHSDADSLCHAVADALLGAAGLGEIGALFPDNDPRWKGMKGGDLLRHIAVLLADGDWSIGNVDAVLIAERPRLAGFRDAMVAGIAEALQTRTSCVSVKIKSNEGVDAVGRAEAIAAHAIARIEKRSREA